MASTPIKLRTKRAAPETHRAPEESLETVALQQIAESLKETNGFLHQLNNTVQDMRVKVAALETHDLAAKYSALEQRLNVLESIDYKAKGAKEFRQWILAQVPWFITLAIAILGWWLQANGRIGIK
jgi:hypothetical protein